VNQIFAMPHNITAVQTMNTVQWMSHIWHNHSSKHALWDLTSCSLAEVSWCFWRTCCPHLHISMNSIFLTNITQFLPHFTASYPT
jgi:hypothetical protein